MSSVHAANDKHIVVTGGGRGIGAAIAARLAGLRTKVTLFGRDQATLAARAAALPGAQYRVVDVTDPQAVAAVFDALPSVDVLINNAGSAPSAPFHKMSHTTWEQTLAVNLNGVYYCSRAVISDMLNNGYGRIINIASTSALKGYAYVAAYCAAKHGTLGLTRALAVEYAGKNITVNAICPGFTDTDLLTGAVDNIVASTGMDEEQARTALSANNPQQRFIEPDEVAGTVVWLLSDAASSITGQAIAVCGGEVM